MKQYQVTLRQNGVIVKQELRPSRYAAKALARRWDENYDLSHTIEIERVGEE